MAQQLINFIVLGCMYSIIALGFTLYFGTSNIINFSHGDMCALGAFTFLVVASYFNATSSNGLSLAFIMAAIITLLATILWGLLSERFLFRKVLNRPPLEGLIISIALSILIREIILRFYPNGGNPQSFPDPFQLRAISISGVIISYSKLLLLITSIIVAAVFYWILERTHLGRTMRALAQDYDAAVMTGLPAGRVIKWTFVMGAGFAAVGGMLNGIVYGSVKYDMGLSLGIKGFVAAIIGGLDNPNGAFLGGLLLALMETLTVVFIPHGSSYRDVITFGVLIIILLLRPSGLISIAHKIKK
jgi:branched-chain amino acid transport system permease protein